MDLYCGVGIFGSFLSDKFKKIIAVEHNRSSLKFARKNIKASNTLFFDKSVEYLEKTHFGESVQLILVNPPRTGLTNAVRQFILRMAPKQLIYISCNAVTQARDLKTLTQGGYTISDCKLFDFYPQTAYVESVIKLTSG